jgi:hypothetical protein
VREDNTEDAAGFITSTGWSVPRLHTERLTTPARVKATATFFAAVINTTPTAGLPKSGLVAPTQGEGHGQ